VAAATGGDGDGGGSGGRGWFARLRLHPPPLVLPPSPSPLPTFFSPCRTIRPPNPILFGWDSSHSLYAVIARPGGDIGVRMDRYEGVRHSLSASSLSIRPLLPFASANLPFYRTYAAHHVCFCLSHSICSTSSSPTCCSLLSPLLSSIVAHSYPPDPSFRLRRDERSALYG